MTKLLRGLQSIKLPEQGCVVTIGNFDGVHKGHQALVSEIIRLAKKLNTSSMVITFEPQPAEFFSEGKTATPRLTRLREKFHALAQYGVNYVLVLPFNKKLADLSAEDFVKTILHDALKVKHVLVGQDFHFGKARKGDVNVLKSLATKYGFVADTLANVEVDNARVSSTSVRNALASGDQTLVKKLLGRPYTMEGKVRFGDKRGRTIGFPTANIFLHRQATPVTGVYVVAVHGLPESPLPGVANVGIRPTVDGTRSLLEVHIFDFDREIYGENVVVEFCEKLRDEKRYDSFELLKEQINKDALAAREWWMTNQTIQDSI